MPLPVVGDRETLGLSARRRDDSEVAVARGVEPATVLAGRVAVARVGGRATGEEERDPGLAVQSRRARQVSTASTPAN